MYCSTVIVILHREYKTNLTASAEEEQQELLRVFSKPREGYAQRATDLNVGK